MKYSILSFLLLVLISCGANKGPQKFVSPQKVNKSVDAQLACRELKIPADVKLNGRSLYYFPQCASNLIDGEESLAGTINVVRGMGQEGLENLSQLLKADPDGKKSTQDEYPLIKAMTVFIERGTFDQGGVSKSLIDERFGPFQDFLKEFNPFYVSHLLIQMSKSGALKDLLDQFSSFVETVEMQSLFGLSHSCLTKQQLRNALIYSANRILNTENYYNSLKGILTLEDSITLNTPAQTSYLQDWKDPKYPGSEPVEFSASDIKGDDKPKNGAQRYQEFVDSLDDGEIKRAASFVSNILREFTELDSERRLSVIRKLYEGGTMAFMEQASFMRNLLALSDYFTNQVKISDFSEVIRAIKELIEYTGPVAIKSLNQKVGSAKLHSLAEELLINGGKVSGCGEQNFVGLKSVDLEDMEQLYQTLNTFLRPNAGCQHQLSPLAQFIINRVRTEVGIVDGCNPENLEDPCFLDESVTLVSENLQGLDWTVEARVDSKVFADLLLEIFADLRFSLERDPYALYWDHLSVGKVDLSDLVKLEELVRQLDEITPESIAGLDEKIDRDDQLKRIYHPNLLENLINNKIEDLSALSEQFNDLFNKDSDPKTKFLLGGLYNHGPFEQLLSSKMYRQEMTGLAMPQSDFRVNDIFARLRRPGGLFKNSRLHKVERVLDFDFLGEKSNAVKYAYQRQPDKKYKLVGIEFKKDPHTPSKIFNNDFWRFEKILQDAQNVNLLGKDVRDGENDQFVEWARNHLYEYLTAQTDWNHLAESSKRTLRPLNIKFFDSEKYSTEEMRKLAHFYSQQFLVAPGYFPADKKSYYVEELISSSAPYIKTQFMALPYERGTKWSTFLNYFPSALMEATDSFESWVDSITQGLVRSDFEGINWKGLPEDKNGKRDLQGYSGKELELIKLLSSLNLLTTNRADKYMPFVGTGNQCHFKTGEESLCPVTFNDYIDEQGVNRDAFDSLKKYVADNVRSLYCPFVSTSHFSKNFVSQMGQALGLPQMQDASFCQQQVNLFAEQDDNLQWMHELVLGDILRMGKNPRLVTGLNKLGSLIRYHKLKNKYSTNKELFLKDFINARGLLPDGMNRYAFKRLADHMGFLVYNPGSINIYNFFIWQSMMQENDYFDNALAYLGAGVKRGDDLARGVGQRFLEDIVVKTYEQNAERDESILYYVFEVVRKLAKKENREFLDLVTNILVYPQDVETLFTYTETIPLLLFHIEMAIPSQVSFWKRPGCEILRHIIFHQEKMRSLNDWTAAFDYRDIYSALETVADSFELLGSSNQISRFVEKGVTLLKNSLMTRDLHGEANIEKLERNVRNFILENAPNDDYKSLNILLEYLPQAHMGFDGKPTGSVLNQLEPIFEFGIKSAHRLLAIYQGHFDKSNMKINDDYLQKMGNAFLTPMQSASGAKGAINLAAILSNDDLGGWDSLYRPLLFSPIYQPLVLATLKASDEASLDDYVQAVEESTQLMPKLNNTINYVLLRMEDWKSDDAKYGLESALRIFEDDNLIWNKQMSLMQLWLARAPR